MIGHDYIPTDSDSAGKTCLTENDESLMHAFICEQTPSAMRIKRDEVQRWVVSLKDAF